MHAGVPENAQSSRKPSSELQNAGTADLDELEGYLSPGEDAFSVFSDEQYKQKPYVQV